MAPYGVYSEVGKLRKVLVHRPDLSLKRLTPENAHDLLFDDVLWVKKARWEHDVFVDQMRSRGIEVLLVGDLLTETLNDPSARGWLLDRKITPNELGLTLSQEMRAWLSEMDAPTLAIYLTGGLTFSELPRDFKAMEVMIAQPSDFVLFPLPNQLFTRDTSCWIYNGVTLNPMYWPARRQETLNIAAIYRFHPAFRDAQFEYWYGDVDQDHGKAHVEGGDVMPIGNKVVIIGMGERTTPPGCWPDRTQPLRERRCRTRHRRTAAAQPRPYAPGYRLHILRPRPGDRLFSRRRAHSDIQHSPGRERASNPGDVRGEAVR